MFLSLEDPQLATLPSSTFAETAALDLGVRFALDFARGFHDVGRYTEHNEWTFSKLLGRVRLGEGSRQSVNADPRWHQLKQLEALQERAKTFGTANLFRFAPRHLGPSLLQLYSELGHEKEGEGVEWEGAPDNVVGQLLWLLGQRDQDQSI